jgi:hypothetical protein
METKKGILSDEDRADLKLAENHLKIAQRHRQLASDALARVKKRREPDFDMDEFDPFDTNDLGDE